MPGYSFFDYFLAALTVCVLVTALVALAVIASQGGEATRAIRCLESGGTVEHHEDYGMWCRGGTK